MRSEIQLLPSEVVDQIAAGEVVERPSHLVKELLENALDAGADEIQVEVFNGGRHVRISDNGQGIAPGHLAKALERFTTSKITKTEDLWSLSSYGFRGEALASIAAVSELTLTSRQQGFDAYQLRSDFGKKTQENSVSREIGTTIEVRNLFENVPARLKFLKSSTAEAQQIKNMIKALALGAWQVKIKLMIENELSLLYTKAESWQQRAVQVLEQDGLLFAEHQHEGVSMRAAFTSPSVTAKTSRQMWFFVNHRWVQDKSIQAAVMDAFRSLLMHGEFPICSIWVEVAKDRVDVNIHPTKSQVKFLQPSEVFRCVQQGIRKKLEEGVRADKMFIPNEPVNQSFASRELDAVVYQKKQIPQHAFSAGADESGPWAQLAPNPPIKISDLRAANSLSVSDFLVETSKEFSTANSAVSKNKGFWSRLEVLAQLHLTYILAQSETSLYIVDQHAAHERVAFESLMEAFRGGQIDRQVFLFPLSLDLPADQCEALLTQKAELFKMGIEVELGGPQTILINSAPTLLKDSAIVESLQKLALQILELGGGFVIEKKIIDVCATMACHSVVRAGQSLSHAEMRSLLEMMDQYPMSGFCPHGRPVHIELPIAKIEKDFGRIL